MIISLLFLETLASLSKDEILIIIDEPELHLHPSLQEQFIRYLKKISPDKQIIVSTHSPYFFKNCFSDDNIKLLVTEVLENNCIVMDSNIQLQTFPWSPSWGEINYFAYNLPTVEFFNELYGYLHELSGTSTIEKFDDFLEYRGHRKLKIWNKKQIDGSIIPINSTIMTFIRNSIHHKENRNNQDFTPDELQCAIEKMLEDIEDINNINKPF